MVYIQICNMFIQICNMFIQKKCFATTNLPKVWLIYLIEPQIPLDVIFVKIYLAGNTLLCYIAISYVVRLIVMGHSVLLCFFRSDNSNDVILDMESILKYKKTERKMQVNNPSTDSCMTSIILHSYNFRNI